MWTNSPFSLVEPLVTPPYTQRWPSTGAEKWPNLGGGSEIEAPALITSCLSQLLVNRTLTNHTLSCPAPQCFARLARLLLKPGTGRDKRGISRPVPPTKTRDGIEFYCKRIRRKQRKGSRLLERGTELLGVTTSAAAGEE